MSRLRRAAVALVLSSVLAAAACDANPERSPLAENTKRGPQAPKERSPRRSPASPTETTTPEDGPSPAPEVDRRYPPDARLPGRPAPIARALATVHSDLQRDIERWLADGGSLQGSLVARIERAALFQQRVYRKMAGSPSLARAVIARLERPLRGRALANFEAGRGLSAGLQPVKPPIRLEAVEPAPPHRLLSFYRTAQRRFLVDWTILAAINFVETRFGRVLGPSSAGALGPMQFLPSTWARYGGGGDILDPRDAILGAARYLRASNVLDDPRAAIFAYNHSNAYVDAVLTYARQMQQRPETFYEYYFWQVFVRTTKGDVQLTGPGAQRS